MKKIIKLILGVLFIIMLITITSCGTEIPNTVPVESITILGSDSVNISFPEQYNAVITPDNATNKTVAWEIVSGMAEIDNNGVLLANGIGTVTIKAIVENISTTKQITVTDKTTIPSKDPIDPLNADFNGFEKVNENTYMIKVSNATEYLNVANIATIKSDWKLTTDMQASNEIPSKIATPLNVGDNEFYVLVSYKNDVRLYNLIIRRKPIYEVTFNTNGGSLIDTQYIEEDAVISKPTEPTKNGYKFVSWNKDISAPILQDISFIANWTVEKYDISYYLDNGINGNNPNTYNIESETIILQYAEKSGYVFYGWYLDSNFTQLIESINTGNYGDLKLYAKFKPEPTKLSAPTIEWDDFSNIITVINTDANADSVDVTLNGTKINMKKNDCGFYYDLGVLSYVGKIITISAFATSIDKECFSDSEITNYTSPYINRTFIKVVIPNILWSNSSKEFTINGICLDDVKYTMTYDRVVIMENNRIVSDNGIGNLSRHPGVLLPSSGFNQYTFYFSPFSPESGKTLTITFQKTVDPNFVEQYYFESESVTYSIP